MDVLRPTLVRIGGRVYRKNIIHEQVQQQEEEEEDFYTGPSDCADEPCDAFVVEETEKGFQCRVEVPSPLYKYIIGKKGETKKRLETETRTSISIPKPGVEGEIVITGQQRGAVISARTRIDVLLDSFRKKQPFTHFLSFALNQPVIQEKFLQFKEEVLEKCSQDHGVSSSLFQNPAKLHLTLGTLVLLNEQEIQKACDLLQQCKEDFVDQITGGKPLSVEVVGVEYMNDDPAMMDVLYAKVHMKDGSDKLQVIADQLVERFVASGLMLREWDRVKLHATVMNTLFRKDPSGAEERSSTVTGKSSFKERESFNGRNILKVSMKQLEKWSQLLILDSQKRLKHLFKTAFVFGLWDRPEGGICLENKHLKLLIGSSTIFNRSVLKAGELRSGVRHTNAKWVLVLSFTLLVFYPGDLCSCWFAAHPKGRLCCSCFSHSCLFLCR
uniref:Activating signal cointegrator 1 complex subunit 1 n=1 Tax=Pavo cristatus TaxID=9049 RepID=A0A8C9F609_PAVCR